MNNVCSANWIGLLGINVCSSINDGLAKVGNQTKSHHHLQVEMFYIYKIKAVVKI